MKFDGDDMLDRNRKIELIRDRLGVHEGNCMLTRDKLQWVREELDSHRLDLDDFHAAGVPAVVTIFGSPDEPDASDEPDIVADLHPVGVAV